MSHLRKKLSSGETVLGTWTIIPSPINIEVMGLAGFDFQILDMEHGAFDLTNLENCIRSCESTGCAPLVRSPGINPNIVQNALDFGAHGIIFPQVQNATSAQEALKSMFYAPIGSRGYNPFTRAGNYSLSPSNKLNNEFPLSSVIIENKKSLEDIDKILEIKDLDVVYLGVYDMSVALGCMGDMENPKIKSFVESSLFKIRKAKKHAGVMVKNEEDIKNLSQLGANFLVYSVDSHLLSKAAQKGKELLNLALNNKG
ncbi:MAG: aldolase/citrate lyase family protein [Bdellovibrionota bacterium]